MNISIIYLIKISRITYEKFSYVVLLIHLNIFVIILKQKLFSPMHISLQQLKVHLEKLSYVGFSHLNEYQNKFYLKKEIQTVFPEIPDEIVYKSIETTNICLHEYYLSKKYITMLSSQIISLFNLKKGDNGLN